MLSLASFMPLYKLIAVFAIMLTALRLRVGLLLSIALGSLSLALLFALPVALWPETVWNALTTPQTLYLAIILALILVLSDVLDKTGQAGRLMESLAGYLRHPRLRLVFFPALIGLLPMPGGAVFSAPMLGNVAERLNVPGEDKVLLNYWFRHIWETTWPLYPGLILAATICDISIGVLVLYGLPALGITLTLGWIFLLRPGVLPLDISKEATITGERDIRKVLVAGRPLLVAIVGAVVMEIGIGLLLPGIPFEIGVMAALLAAILVALAQNPGSGPIVRDALCRKHLWTMLGVVVVIFIFKDTLHAAGVITELAKLAGGRTALFITCTLLPFLVGFVSGITLAYVGSTFPLITGLLAQAGMQDQQMPYIMLAIFSGYTGIMSSPLHICFVLTCQYFNVGIGKAWRRIALPSLLIFLSGVAYFLLLSR